LALNGIATLTVCVISMRMADLLLPKGYDDRPADAGRVLREITELD